jgi:hypothetical protein
MPCRIGGMRGPLYELPVVFLRTIRSNDSAVKGSSGADLATGTQLALPETPFKLRIVAMEYERKRGEYLLLGTGSNLYMGVCSSLDSPRLKGRLGEVNSGDFNPNLLAQKFHPISKRIESANLDRVGRALAFSHDDSASWVGKCDVEGPLCVTQANWYIDSIIHIGVTGGTVR